MEEGSGGEEGRGRIISLTSHYNLERTLVFHSPPPSPISHPKPLVLSSLSSQLSSCFSLCSTRDPRLSSPSSPPSFELAWTALPLSCPLQPCVQTAHRPRENPKSNHREHTQSHPSPCLKALLRPPRPWWPRRTRLIPTVSPPELQTALPLSPSLCFLAHPAIMG